MSRTRLLAVVVTFCYAVSGNADEQLRKDASDAMKRAATYYRTKVATNGGYVYYYALDLGQRWGEGEASATQIWVQPPGTPTVGMAYLKAFEATGDRFYLDAAKDAALALVYGQLQSGGWTNSIDFNPRGKVAKYRNGKGGGRNHSAFDDGITQAALQLLMRAVSQRGVSARLDRSGVEAADPEGELSRLRLEDREEDQELLGHVHAQR